MHYEKVNIKRIFTNKSKFIQILWNTYPFVSIEKSEVINKITKITSIRSDNQCEKFDKSNFRLWTIPLNFDYGLCSSRSKIVFIDLSIFSSSSSSFLLHIPTLITTIVLKNEFCLFSYVFNHCFCQHSQCPWLPSTYSTTIIS